MSSATSLETLLAERSFVEQRLTASSEGPWGTGKLVWQGRLDEINAAITELNRTTEYRARLTLLFAGEPVRGSSAIRADFAAKAIAAYQKFVSLTWAAGLRGSLARLGRPPRQIQSKLFITGIARGSMGFTLEEDDEAQTALVPTVLYDTVDSAAAILDSLVLEPADVTSTDLILHPRVLGSIKEFVDVVNDAHASVKIISNGTLRAYDFGQIERLASQLRLTEVAEMDFDMVVILNGVFPDALECEMRQHDGKVIRAGITEELANLYLANRSFVDEMLLRQVRAYGKVSRSSRGGTALGTQYTVERFERLAEIG